jgi:hypothetical protein
LQYQLVRKTIASLGGIINHKKTKLVTTLADHKAHEFIEQERLPEDCLAPSLKYLGVHIRPPYTNRCWGTHIRMRVAKAWAAYHLLTQKGMPRDGRFVQIGLEIYKCLVQPILLYGAEVYDLGAGDRSLLRATQAQILKSILGLPRAAPNEWVDWEAGVVPATHRIQTIKLRAYWKHKSWASTYHPRTHVIRVNPVLSRTMALLTDDWGIDPADYFRPDSSPLVSRSAWLKRVTLHVGRPEN